MPKHTIVMIPGDGIGPEVTTAARRVFEAAGLQAEWVELPAGASALDQGHDNVLPQRTVAAIQAHKVALKGPVTTPGRQGVQVGQRPASQALNLYAAVRPGAERAGREDRFDNVDIVVVRENTEGLYSGIENEVTPGRGHAPEGRDRGRLHRIARYAFRYATAGTAREITVFHKATS
jgi:isocitrate dehydrogenase (NAD+)